MFLSVDYNILLKPAQYRDFPNLTKPNLTEISPPYLI